VGEVVAWAAAEAKPLSLEGRGSKQGYGRPVEADYGLRLEGLAGVILYEPAELVLSARAGTPMAEIEAALGAENQQLAFEPPDLGPLYGAAAGGASLGGVLACNLSGPRRPKAGAARDHFLGFQGVSGRGEAFKSGGRVVKNVTGYDLCKLMAGSFGTLAVLTEVTVKVMPVAEKLRSVLLYGLDDRQALLAMTRAMQSAHEVSAAAHLPAAAARDSAVAYVAEAGRSVTALRVEGPGPSAVYRAARLVEELAEFGASEELHSTNSRTFWRELGELRPFQGHPAREIWRVSLPPQAGPALVEAAREVAGGELFHYYDWAGGLVWLALPAASPETEGRRDTRLRAALGEEGGHATLFRAAPEARTRRGVFQPQAPALAALTRRIKAGFDPQGVLNPGRLYEGL
jgi:glycolate oxidase FAD binding subunit